MPAPSNMLDERAALLVARLAALGPDIVEAFSDLVSRVEKGAEIYGLLDLSTNPRDWDVEAYEEMLDLAWYRAFARIKRKQAGR